MILEVLLTLLEIKGLQKEQFLFLKKINSTSKNYLIKLKNGAGLKDLDLAEKVTTKKNYIWKGLRTWKKEKGFIKNDKKLLHVVAIDYGIKKNILRYFSDFNCKVSVVSCKTNALKF